MDTCVIPDSARKLTLGSKKPTSFYFLKHFLKKKQKKKKKKKKKKKEEEEENYGEIKTKYNVPERQFLLYMCYVNGFTNR
jgi:hypothetical protein